MTFFVELSASIEPFGVWSREKDGTFVDKAHVFVFEVVDWSLVHHSSLLFTVILLQFIVITRTV
jgi:hypothetical protein